MSMQTQDRTLLMTSSLVQLGSVPSSDDGDDDQLQLQYHLHQLNEEGSAYGKKKGKKDMRDVERDITSNIIMSDKEESVKQNSTNIPVHDASFGGAKGRTLDFSMTINWGNGISRQRMEGDILSNLNLSKLCSPIGKDLLMAAGCGRAEALNAVCSKGVFFSKCVRIALSKTKTTRKFKVLVVGGAGGMGRHLVRALIDRDVVGAENIVVVTRAGFNDKHNGTSSPESPTSPLPSPICTPKQSKHDNNTVKALPDGIAQRNSLSVALQDFLPRMVFLCCSRAQLDDVASTLSPLMKETIIVCSVVAGVTINKLQSLLNLNCATTPYCHPIRAVHYRLHDQSTVSTHPPLTDKQVAWDLFETEEPVLLQLVEALFRQANGLGVRTEVAQQMAADVVFGNSRHKYEPGVSRARDQTNLQDFQQHFVNHLR